MEDYEGDDIEFFSVYDERLVQKRAKYAVEKGAMSITSAKATTNSQTNSQHSYNLNVPSLTVILDRAIDIQSEIYLHLQVNTAQNATVPPAANPPNAGEPVMLFGSNIACAGYPLHQLFSTISVTINDTTITNNVENILVELLRLTDSRANTISRTFPSQLDKYKYTRSGIGAINSPISNFNLTDAYDQWDNGAYFDVFFCNQNRERLYGAGQYTGAAGTIPYIDGIPRIGPGTGTILAEAIYDIYIGIKTTEKLVCSPFIWCNSMCDSAGLFGLKNIQFTITIKSDVSRCIRTLNDGVTLTGNRVLTSVNYHPLGGFNNSAIYAQFLTPTLSIRLPPKSICPYFHYQKTTTRIGDVAAATTSIDKPEIQHITSGTYTLSQVPDMVMVYIKPVSIPTTQGDFYLPITNISIVFDNYSGLLASHQPEHLFRMSLENGLKMDWNSWNGYAIAATNALNTTDYRTLTTGGFLLLAFGKDIPLQEGLAPGIVGNFSFSAQLTYINRDNVVIPNCNLYMTFINSGFFETKDGMSRLIGAPLNEAVALSAPMSVSNRDLDRMVGGSFWSKLKSGISSVGNWLMKPEVRKAVKGFVGDALPYGKTAVNIAESLGYGAGNIGEGSFTGGRSYTGGRARKKTSLVDRLKDI